MRLDGRLDDDIWRVAEPIVDFTQKEPTEGAEPMDRMEVRFAYDDSALYVGARRYTRASRDIQAPLGRRDHAGQTEHIILSLDTFLDRTEFRLGLTLKPDMNLDVYAEPFAASGRYYDHGELRTPRSADRIIYGQSGTLVDVFADGSREVRIGDSAFTLRNRDFNNLSFRSNVVLRWEWRPGRTFYAVWQQDRSGIESVGTPVGVGDMFRSITATGTNVFVIKTSFWVPVR